MSAPSPIVGRLGPGREVVRVRGHARVRAHPGVAEQVPRAAESGRAPRAPGRTPPGTRAPGGRPRRCPDSPAPTTTTSYVSSTSRSSPCRRGRLLPLSVVRVTAGGSGCIAMIRFLRSPSEHHPQSRRRSVRCDEVEAIPCWRPRTSARARWGQGSSRSGDRGGPLPSLPSLPSIEPSIEAPVGPLRARGVLPIDTAPPRAEPGTAAGPAGTRRRRRSRDDTGPDLVVGGARGAGGAARPGGGARARGDGGEAVRLRRRRQAGPGDRGAGPEPGLGPGGRRGGRRPRLGRRLPRRRQDHHPVDLEGRRRLGGRTTPSARRWPAPTSTPTASPTSRSGSPARTPRRTPTRAR